MRLLILGGTKFLGKALVAESLAKGHIVTVISLEEPEFLDQITWINVDRNDQPKLAEALKDLEFDSIIDNIAYNGVQVRKLLIAAQNKFKRYVLTSTVDIYQNYNRARADEVLHEKIVPFQADKDGKFQYAPGKRAAEIQLKGWIHSDIEWAIIRPSIVFGLHDNVNLFGFGRSLYFASKVIDDGPILLHVNDRSVFNLAYANDVASALLLCAEHPDAHGQVFNVTGDEQWTTESFIRKHIEVSGRNNKIVRVNQQELLDGGVCTGVHERLPSTYRTDFYRSHHKWMIFSNERLKSLGWVPTLPEVYLKEIMDNDLKLLEVANSLRETRQKEISTALKIISAKPLDYEYKTPGYFTGEISSIGIGTFNGTYDQETDDLYYNSINTAIKNGINLIDTAINYRDMRSEKVVGKVIRDGVINKVFTRDSVCVVTKGGYSAPQLIDNSLGLSREFGEGVIDVEKRRHCIAPSYIDLSFEQSYKNLNLKTIDIYLLHNVELGREVYDIELFYDWLTLTFAVLEDKVRQGKLKHYGIATWVGLRNNFGNDKFVSLEKMLDCAKVAAGSDDHHFKAIELPFNANYFSPANLANQSYNGKMVSTLEFAQLNDLIVLTSNSALYGKHNDRDKKLDVLGFDSTTKNNIQFVRSYPGVTCALIGMRQEKHVLEAVEILKAPKADTKYLDDIIPKLTMYHYITIYTRPDANTPYFEEVDKKFKSLNNGFWGFQQSSDKFLKFDVRDLTPTTRLYSCLWAAESDCTTFLENNSAILETLDSWRAQYNKEMNISKEVKTQLL